MRSQTALGICLCLTLGTVVDAQSALAQPQYHGQPSPGQTQAFSAPGSAGQSGQITLQQKIDNLVQSKVTKFGVPGYSVCVIRKGEVILQKGYGVGDMKSRAPITPETAFGLASITKTFTAMALLVLVDRGLIDLESPLEKYLPDIPKEWKPITIRQLASMSAGMRKGIPRETPWPQEFETLKGMPLLFQPGSDFEYSNPSYRTLGSVIEKVTKAKYMDVLNDLVLLPLGMNSTGTTDEPKAPQTNAFRLDMQTGETFRIPYKDTRISFSAGALSSNTIDMAKYAQALLQKDILSPASYRTLWYERSPLPSGKPGNWAFGWGCNSFMGQLMLAMNGGDPGVSSSIMILPESKIIIIGLSNIHSKEIYRLPKIIARMLLEDAGATPSPSQGGAANDSPPGETPEGAELSGD